MVFAEVNISPINILGRKPNITPRHQRDALCITSLSVIANDFAT